MEELVNGLKDMVESIELQRQISRDLLECVKALKNRIDTLEAKIDIIENIRRVYK